MTFSTTLPTNLWYHFLLVHLDLSSHIPMYSTWLSVAICSLRTYTLKFLENSPLLHLRISSYHILFTSLQFLWDNEEFLWFLTIYTNYCRADGGRRCESLCFSSPCTLQPLLRSLWETQFENHCTRERCLRSRISTHFI